MQAVKKGKFHPPNLGLLDGCARDLLSGRRGPVVPAPPGASGGCVPSSAWDRPESMTSGSPWLRRFKVNSRSIQRGFCWNSTGVLLGQGATFRPLPRGYLQLYRSTYWYPRGIPAGIAEVSLGS